jgi:uncharacterized small protein (DUF1192 family)
VKEAMLASEQSHLRSKRALTDRIEGLKAEGMRLEAELSARRAAAADGSNDGTRGGDEGG